jgi:integrase
MGSRGSGLQESETSVHGRDLIAGVHRTAHVGAAKQDHKYERDSRIPAWHGWHACRRGLASNLNRLGVDDSVIQRMSRHSNINVTQSYYIKTSGDDVRDAMGKLEENYAAQTAAQTLRDSARTLKLDSGAMPESVN